jgi:hypothetical protein
MTFLKWQLKNIYEKIMKTLQLHFSKKKKKQKKGKTSSQISSLLNQSLLQNLNFIDRKQSESNVN